MPKQISYLMLLPFLCLAYSCTLQDELDSGHTVSNDTEQTLMDIAKTKLLSMGFDTLGVEDVGKYYLVENDVLVDKDKLLSHIDTRQFTTNNVVADSSTIRIAVDASTISKTSGWLEAAKDVADIYHEYAALDFVFVDSNPDILITKAYISGAYVCAQGVFPYSSKPGDHVYINTHFYKDIDSYLSHKQKVFLLMHEIGHNLGLRHTDCKKNGEGESIYGMNLVPGTPESDEYSYMNSSTCGKEWTGMSRLDAVTLATLWPYSFKIHFEDADVSDIIVKQQRTYYLSRLLIPKKKGFVFSGWRNTLQAYSPFCYNSALTMNRTLYATWRQAHDLVKKYVYTGEGENSITFYLGSATPVTFTSNVHRALNSWYDLRKYEGTYSKLEKIDGACNTTLIIDMRNNEMWASDDVYHITRSATFMLEEGRYKLTSSITTKLGDQNDTSMGKHGSVESSVEYY